MTKVINNDPRSGQAIAEAVVALGILSVGFLGLFSLLSQSLGLNRVVSDNYTATYLAAEGLEIARNAAANYAISPGGNSLGLFSSCLPPSGCAYEADYRSGLVSATGKYLRYDPATGFYSYDPEGQDTQFKRTLTVTLQDGFNGKFADVRSKVTWQTRGGTSYAVDVDDRLYGWR